MTVLVCGVARAAPKPAADKPETINELGTYKSGKWKYRYERTGRSRRDLAYWGTLYFSGKEVGEAGSINDHYQTPWGKLYWMGREGWWGWHGWNPNPHYGMPMGRLLPRPGLKPAGGKPETTGKPGTYKSGKWEYRLPMSGRPGTRGYASSGSLYYDGKGVPHFGPTFNDHYLTPWGKMYWVGWPRIATGRHGWYLQPVSRTPMGRLLPLPDQEKQLVITERCDGKTVVAVGVQKVLIRLAADATTGHVWTVKRKGTSLDKWGKVRYVRKPGPDAAVGAGRYCEMLFRVGRPGKTTIECRYVRRKERDKKPAKVFTVTVDVQPDPTAQRANGLNNTLGRFFLRLEYHGPRDKRYGSLFLYTKPTKIRAVPAWLNVHISKAQAEGIVDHLALDGFLVTAKDTTGAKIEAPGGPAYTLTMSNRNLVLYEDFGWGLPVLGRLEALGKALDGDAAKAMDKLLVPLRALRKQWQETEVLKQGLKQIEIPRGSVVRYAAAPAGTQFIPGQHLGVRNPIPLQNEGYVLFIDEQPGYDWEHRFQLVFIPKTSGKPHVLFRGSAIPDFRFKKPDGSTITKWQKY